MSPSRRRAVADGDARSRGRRSRRAEEDDLDLHAGECGRQRCGRRRGYARRVRTTRRSARERDEPLAATLEQEQRGPTRDRHRTRSGTSRMICQARSRNSGSGTSSPRSAASARWPRLMAAPGSRRAGSSRRSSELRCMIESMCGRGSPPYSLGDAPERLALPHHVRRRDPSAVRRAGREQCADQERENEHADDDEPARRVVE